MTKKQFIEHCIINKLSIIEIRDYLKLLNNPELNKITDVDFINHDIVGYFNIQYDEKSIKQYYEMYYQEPSTILEYENEWYLDIIITEFISWYIKNVKFEK